jgi:hypothetical protein
MRITEKPNTGWRRSRRRSRGNSSGNGSREAIGRESTLRLLEVPLDAVLLPGISWDVTWNHWKYWLSSRIKVEATFIRTGKYRFCKAEWILRTWLTALPSRLRVTMPDDITADIERAQAIHALLGERADLVKKFRARSRSNRLSTCGLRNGWIGWAPRRI